MKSIQSIKWLVIGMLLCCQQLLAGTTEDTDYLCFTAQTTKSTVALNKVGSPTTANLQYSTDKVNWNSYSFNTKITLSAVGDKVYFRATSTNSGFCWDIKSYYQFVMTGKIAGSGNIMSLLDNTCKQTTVSARIFTYLFKDCASLTSAPKLPATTVYDSSYQFMFYGCSSLKSAPELPAMIMKEQCYRAMFANCSSLTYVPDLPATTLAVNCYLDMFDHCTSLENAPKLPATQLDRYCYCTMFRGCSSLKNAPKLPATTLTNNCYNQLFYGCKKLEKAPYLPAKDINYTMCYQWLFYNCSLIDTIRVAFTSWPSISSATNAWVSGVKSSGVFDAPCELPDQRGINYIPTNWKKTGCEEEKDTIDYLCFTAQQASSTIRLKTNSGQSGSIKLQYSTDKTTWKDYTLGSVIKLTQIGDYVYFRAKTKNSSFSLGNAYFYQFVMTGMIAGSGNIMSLLDNTCKRTDVPEDAFRSLFSGCTALTSSPKLPATTLSKNCYPNMFSGCSGLTTAPKLPAKILKEACYAGMFQGCSSLVNVPDLEATTMEHSACLNMFSNCTALKSAPALPAMQLDTVCYSGMFLGCTSLTKAPQLPAKALDDMCYVNMFRGCTSLVTAPALPATQLAYNCYWSMFMECTNLTQAPILPATTLFKSCYNMMFSGCTSLVTAPALPATTLVESCYSSMFDGCTSLVNAPTLPALTLVNRCYSHMFSNCTSLSTAPFIAATNVNDEYCCYNMFKGCSSLDTIKVAFSAWPTASNALSYWVSGVKSSGVFDAPCELPDVRGINRIPNGWIKTGCDTIKTTIIVSTCGSYVWNNQTYTNSGVYEQQFKTIDGLDSIVTLTLHVNQPSAGDTTAVECSSFTWYGNTYTTSGDYTHTLTSHVGCDSIVTLTLYVDELTQGDTTAIECMSFTWYGNTYTSSGDYTHMLVNKAGCDSALTLHLTISQTKQTTLSETICEGSAFMFDGKQLTQAGLYQATFPTSAGCDSVVDLTLNVLSWPKAEFNLGELCADDSVLYLRFDDIPDDGLSYQLVWDVRAVDNGFVSNANSPLTSSGIIVPLPRKDGHPYTVPNAYSAQLIVTNELCDGSKTYPITFTMLYPSWVIYPKWNDVIGVMNKGYNGGFQFTNYQWYLNDQPVAGGNNEVLYIPEGLTTGDYSALVTRESDGVSVMTCAYHYEAAKSVARYSARVTPTVMNRHDKYFVIDCNMPTTYRIYDALGVVVEQGQVEEGNTRIGFDGSLLEGVCIVRCESDEGSVVTTKLIVK